MPDEEFYHWVTFGMLLWHSDLVDNWLNSKDNRKFSEDQATAMGHGFCEMEMDYPTPWKD
jgi:hypothetical protein